MNQHSEKLSALEDSAVGKEDDSKDAAFWQEFAARARLLSIATALLTRRAEALGDAAPDAAEAKRVARAAGEYIVPRLANPVVKIPPKIFREQFFDVFAVGKPRVARTTAFFTAKVDAFGSYVDDLQDSFGIGKKKNPTFKEAVGFAGSKEASDIIKETVGVTGRIEVRVTHDSVVSKKKDARPWLNDPKTTIELRLPANATFRLILDLAARYYVKSRGGLEEVDKSKFLKELWDGIYDGLMNGAENTAIGSSEAFLDMTLGEAAEKSPALKAMLGGVSFLKDKYDADYTFTLAEDYDTEAKLAFTPLPFLEVDLSHTSKTSVTDFMVQPRPTMTSLLSKAADYTMAGNPEGFVNYLNRNKIGVVRMIHAGKAGAGNEVPPRDKYWQTDCTKMSTAIADCQQRLAQLAARQNAIGAEARSYQETFRQIAEKVTGQAANLDTPPALELAAEFFTAAAKVYTLAAMAA